MGRKILVGYDFSETADHALDWAIDLMRTSPGSSLTLLHTLLLPMPSVVPDGVAPIGAVPGPEEVRGYQERLREVAAKRGVEASCEVVVGANAGATVVTRADETGADLVVLGTHGRGPVARALLGSVADHVVRHANCPVVTVRTPHKR